MKNRLLLSTVLLAGILTGCQTDQNGLFSKENIGTALGGIGGAVVGSTIGKGAGQVVGTAFGAVAGAYVGSLIGRKLDQADRAQIAAADQKALESAPDKQISWSSPDSTATGTAQASAPVTETVIKSADGKMRVVPAAPRLALMQGTYTVHAASNVNVRAAPTTRADVVGNVHSGETVDAVGKVVDADWMLVARNGKTLGYIASSLLAPVTGDQTTQASTAPAMPDAPGKAGTVASSITSSAHTAATPAPFKLVEAPVATTPMPVATVSSLPPAPDNSSITCRTVTRTASKDGESGTETVKYCKTANDGWQQVGV